MNRFVLFSPCGWLSSLLDTMLHDLYISIFGDLPFPWATPSPRLQRGREASAPCASQSFRRDPALLADETRLLSQTPPDEPKQEDGSRQPRRWQVFWNIIGSSGPQNHKK